MRDKVFNCYAYNGYISRSKFSFLSGCVCTLNDTLYNIGISNVMYVGLPLHKEMHIQVITYKYQGKVYRRLWEASLSKLIPNFQSHIVNIYFDIKSSKVSLYPLMF